MSLLGVYVTPGATPPPNPALTTAADTWSQSGWFPTGYIWPDPFRITAFSGSSPCALVLHVRAGVRPTCLRCLLGPEQPAWFPCVPSGAEMRGISIALLHVRNPLLLTEGHSGIRCYLARCLAGT